MDLSKIKEVLTGPVLQAVVIYDCEATKEHFIKINDTVSLTDLIGIFGSKEVGPILRWLDPHLDRFGLPYDSAERHRRNPRGPINRYGFAFVMSQQHLEELARISSVDPLTGPKIYDLNKEQKDG